MAQKVSPMKFFGIARQKLFDRKSEYRNITLLRIIFFRYPKLMKHYLIPQRNFSVLWDKKLRRKLLLLSTLSYTYTLPLPEVFWNTALKGSTKKFFCIAKQTNFDAKSWFPPTLYPKYFSIPEINEQLKDSLMNFFGTARQVTFDAKTWYSPPSFNFKLFRCRESSETHHIRVPRRSFSILREKTISTENRATIPHLLPKNSLAKWKFEKHSTHWFPYEVLRYCETKIFRQKSEYRNITLLRMNFFNIRN